MQRMCGSIWRKILKNYYHPTLSSTLNILCTDWSFLNLFPVVILWWVPCSSSVNSTHLALTASPHCVSSGNQSFFASFSTLDYWTKVPQTSHYAVLSAVYTLFMTSQEMISQLSWLQMKGDMLHIERGQILSNIWFQLQWPTQSSLT